MQTKLTKRLTFIGHFFSQIFGTVLLSLFLSFPQNLLAQEEVLSLAEKIYGEEMESMRKGDY